MSFLESSQDPQILFLFQFIQPLYLQRACLRPISNSLYRCSVPYTTRHTRFLVQFLLLLYDNSLSELIYSFLFSVSCSQIYKVVLLLNLSINFLIFRLNVLVIYYRRSNLFSKLIVLKLASHTYSFTLKLSYCPFLLVFVRYGSLGMSYLILRVLSVLHLILRILSLWPFAFIKW